MVYLHVVITRDSAELIQGQNVEALAEDGPLDFDNATVSRQTEGTLPLTVPVIATLAIG